MSNEGRNTYVIEHITDALLKLLKEKSLEDISISKLCELASIGRASFYRNFNSKEDILRAYIHQIFQEWAGEITQNENTPLSELLCSISALFERHKPFYELLNQRNLIYLLKDVIIGFYNLSAEDSKEATYSKFFVAYALNTGFRSVVSIYPNTTEQNPVFQKMPEKPGKSTFLNEKSNCFHAPHSTYFDKPLGKTFFNFSRISVLFPPSFYSFFASFNIIKGAIYCFHLAFS